MSPPAERLDVLVDEIRSGGGRAPGVVDAAPEEDAERDPGERCAARLEATALEIELEEDARIEVTDLRARDEQRLARRRAPGRRRAARSTSAGGSSRQRTALPARSWPRRPRRCRPRSPGARFARSGRGRRPVPPGRRADGGPPTPGAPSRLRASAWSIARNCERRTSCPPPEPNTAPIRPPTATTSFRVQGVSGRPAFLYCALMPATYASIRRIACRPCAPCARSRSNCCASRASVAGLGRKRLTRERERECIDPRRVERRDAPRAAEELHDELPVGSGRPPRAEGDVLCGAALHVRDAPSIARDGHAGARPLGANRLLRPEAERLALEVAPEVGVRHPVASQGQPLVERDLVGRVLRERDPARLPRWKHVPGLRCVVLRAGSEGDRRRHGGRDHQTESDERAWQWTPSFSERAKRRELYV